MLRGSGPSAEILGDGDEASKNGVKDLTYRLSEIEEEFQCAVCLDLIVLPTTLNCGHSFCRHCLAHWFDCGKRTECPSCQQVLIIIMFLSVIGSLHPTKIMNTHCMFLCYTSSINDNKSTVAPLINTAV